jgi:S-formylglutathione hydrolase FrmB
MAGRARAWVAVAAALMALALACPAAGAISFHGVDGLSVVALERLDSRLLALQVRTRALPAPDDLRILLPSGYAIHPRRRYPVLYLFDGTSGLASDWTTYGGAEQTTAGMPLIVVMPNVDVGGDGGGWCTNWPDGAYHWETYHIDQLVPFIDSNLRTLRARGERAIAGLSQGGFCSMSYAAQFPSLFGVALAYSGAPDIAYTPDARVGAMAIINATEVGLDRVPPDSMFGNPISDYLNWAAHDPATLADNLRHTRLYMYFGNGLPGPYDTGAPNPEAMFIEGAVHEDNVDFEARLHSLGITPAVYDDYGDGTHSWPYWARDLRWSIGPLMSDFAHPVSVPVSFTYTTDQTSYAQFGWTVRIHRLAAEFSTLTVAGVRRFMLQGSGSATVRTPARLVPGARYRVRMQTHAGTITRTLRVGRRRRLTIAVPLGPPDTVREYTLGGPPAPSPGTTVYTTVVTIARAQVRGSRGGVRSGRPR